MRVIVRIFMLITVSFVTSESRAAPPLVWTVTTDVSFPSNVGRGWGFSYLPDIAPDPWTHVTAYIREEGTLVGFNTKTCSHTSGTATSCTQFATDPTLTDTCRYCGDATAIVPAGEGVATRSAVQKCKVYRNGNNY